MGSLERETMTQVRWRIMPLLAIGLLFSNLDRGNIGFAALQMKQALGLSNTALGVAGGLLSIGYVAAAIPSTLALQRFGARRWMSLLMVVWGVCSAGTALVSNRDQLALARVILGVADAGFSPGVLLYLTYWLPSEYRGRVLSSFLLVLPAGGVISGPVASGLLSWDGFLGLAGWQWLFIVEGLPTVLLAFVVFRLLPDGPADARWLSQPQREWLTERLAAQERNVAAAEGHKGAWRAVASVSVLSLACAFLGMMTSGGAGHAFLPLIIRSMGFSITQVGFVTATLALLAMASQPLWGVWVDRVQRREVVVVAGCLLHAAGLVCAGMWLPSPWALVPFAVASIGFYGAVAPFWTLPPALLTATSVAAGTAVINLAGNLGGLTGPSLMGWVSDKTGSYGGGLIAGAVPVVLAGTILGVHALRPARTTVAAPSGS